MDKKNNTTWHHSTISRNDREHLNNHNSIILWFTGLSGSGKSTLAHAVEERLFQLQCRTYVLDGDNVRHGLCGDLGFTDIDRQENIRRVGELAKLIIETGTICLSAFISPFERERRLARSLVPQSDFIEIYCFCELAICEKRDTKGLYKKARAGEIQHFTGISSPYEEPKKPELHINTGINPLHVCVEQIIDLLKKRGILKK
jgi:adenylylsulfate kinase